MAVVIVLLESKHCLTGFDRQSSNDFSGKDDCGTINGERLSKENVSGESCR